jgi:hypothetical protein
MAKKAKAKKVAATPADPMAGQPLPVRSPDVKSLAIMTP